MKLTFFILTATLCAPAQVRLTPHNPPLNHTRPPAPPSAPNHAKRTDAAAAKSDVEIEKDFRARLSRSKLRDSGFTIRVQGGVATLEGNARLVQHKAVATRMAKSAGARAVVNRIRVSEAAREQAAENLAKGRRRTQQKRSESRQH